MKRTLILLFFAISSMVMMAQTDKEVNLGEVVVNGARVINKVDGQQIYPTAQQKEKSTSGYSLLNKLALPNIRIDETMHTITSTNNLGDVQVRINDIVASKADLLALDMKAIEHIDYIKNPGVRYGQDIAFVINTDIFQTEFLQFFVKVIRNIPLSFRRRRGLTFCVAG